MFSSYLYAMLNTDIHHGKQLVVAYMFVYVFIVTYDSSMYKKVVDLTQLWGCGVQIL